MSGFAPPNGDASAADGLPVTRLGTERRAGALLLSRTVEQAVLGVGSLLLARAVGLDHFAAISALLILNSIALTLSDYGLGTDALRLEAGRLASLSELRAVRRRNAAVVLVGLVLGVLLEGDVRVVVVGGALLWATSAESFIRRAAALRGGAVRSLVRAELVGAGLIAVGIGAGIRFEDQALELLCAGLLAKQLVEVLLVRSWRAQFGPVSPVDDTRLLWWAQAVAYAAANVDFLMLGLFQPARVFSVYVLAFRLANSLPSQLSFVAGRILSVDFATAAPSDVERLFQRSTRLLFGLGVAGGLVIAGIAPFLPDFLGDEWQAITWVLVALACSLPWRMVLGIAGTLCIVRQRSHELLRLEVVHVGLLGLACAASAAWGLQPFVIVVSASSVLANLAYHGLAGRMAQVRPWPGLRPVAVASLVLIALVGTQVSGG